jgi:hypothetical protein
MPVPFSVAAANVGTLTANLGKLLVEYGVGDPDVRTLSTYIKQLLYDVEDFNDVESPAYILAMATAKLLIGDNSRKNFEFERHGSHGVGIETFASLSKRPNLTIFERLDEPKSHYILNMCEELVEAGNVDSAASVLAEWMKDSRANCGILPCSDNEWMLHIVANSVAITHAQITRAVAKKVTSTHCARFTVDTPTSITLLVEAPNAMTIKASSHIHSANKHILVMGPDKDNQHGFLVPSSGSLSAYSNDVLQAAVHAEIEANPLTFSMASVRGDRVSAAMYETETNECIVLGIYHFKNPKHADWPKQCAELLDMYHTVLSKLQVGATVIMAGDSNLPTVADANEMNAVLQKQYRLTAGNSSSSTFAALFLSVVGLFASKPVMNSCFKETSARGRALPASIGQASKCQDKRKDKTDVANSVGAYESSAKIGFVFDATDKNIASFNMHVGDADKKTPSPEFFLDHRWVLATFAARGACTPVRVIRIIARVLVLMCILLLMGSILTAHV